jgi:hypothetical protein
MENLTTWQPIQPEVLMHLGKVAAQTSQTSGMSLTDAVVRTIGMQKLNAEQVRRVVEHANHTAFHQKYASMDASMRVVELEGGPADPSAVIERLSLAAAPIQEHCKVSDYMMAPMPKVASFVGLGLAHPDKMTKTAALSDVYVLHGQLKSAHEELASEVGALKHRVLDTVRELSGLVKQAMYEGAFHEDLERAWGSVSSKHAQSILRELGLPRAPAHVKVASRKIASEHPLMAGFRKFVKYASDYEAANEAVRSVEVELARVEEYLRRA